MATVTIKEAAQSLGVSQDTVRRRIRKKELQARQTPTPQGFRWAVELGPDIGGAEVEGGQDLRELVDALHSQLQSQEEELAARRREVQELHVLLQQKVLPEGAELAEPDSWLSRPWWAFWR